MRRISVQLPPASVLSGALELNDAKPVFFVSVLNNQIRLDPIQNTSQVKYTMEVKRPNQKPNLSSYSPYNAEACNEFAVPVSAS